MCPCSCQKTLLRDNATGWCKEKIFPCDVRRRFPPILRTSTAAELKKWWLSSSRMEELRGSLDYQEAEMYARKRDPPFFHESLAKTQG